MSERQGLPSASGIQKIALCAGSFKLEQGQPDTSTPESESGTKVHTWLAGAARFDTLTDDEKELGQLCETLAARMVSQWEDSLSLTGDKSFQIETRLWLKVDGKPVMSGQADGIALMAPHGFVWDYKTGRGEVQNPTENMQLRALAVLAAEAYGLETVTVAIIQPLATSEPKLCRYDSAALAIARQELLAILDAANKPDAPLNPGDQQCKYCKAALVCPARRKEFEKLAMTTIHETGLSVSNQDLASLLDKCSAAIRLASQIKAEAQRRAEQDPETWKVLGWEVTTPKGRSEIADMPAVAAKLNEFGVPWDAISARCKMSKGAVKDLLRPVVKGRDITLKDAEWSVLKGNTAQKEGKPRLARIGAGDEEEEE